MAAGKKKRGSGKVAIAIIVLAVLGAMSFQIIRLKNKEAAYAEQLSNLQQEYEEESEKAEELAEQEEYMQSTQYIEDLAKEKLNLSYDNEIIFKESDDE